MPQLPNQRCACGSGKKFKKCCAIAGMRNLTDEEWAERRAARRRAFAAVNGIGAELAGVAAMLMGAPMQRMMEEQEERAQLERLRQMVDSIPQAASREEAQALLASLPDGARIIALHEAGIPKIAHLL